MKPSVPAANIKQIAPGSLQFSGSWTVCHLDHVLQQLDAFLTLPVKSLQLDGQKIVKIDSIAVWVLHERVQKLRDSGIQVKMLSWPTQYQLIIDSLPAKPITAVCAPELSGQLTRIGKASIAVWRSFFAILRFIGEIASSMGAAFLHPRRTRVNTTLHNLQITGVNALAIIGVTSFLLGIVIAYQGAAQLKHYGANIFVVELVGYAMLREFAPLITAIIVAGRSGSAYAAQIGTMLVTEEIAALKTIGIAPIDLLVIPKLFALMLALPLLTLFADVFGVVGGMLMASSELDVSPSEFINRFATEIPLKTLMIGLGKSVIFANVIVIISCYQGLITKANADRVGEQTTHSVVQSIFIVIVLDAGFSVVFNLLDL